MRQGALIKRDSMNTLCFMQPKLAHPSKEVESRLSNLQKFELLSPPVERQVRSWNSGTRAHKFSPCAQASVIRSGIQIYPRTQVIPQELQAHLRSGQLADSDSGSHMIKSAQRHFQASCPTLSHKTLDRAHPRMSRFDCGGHSDVSV